jgi:hypothetical protein
MNLYIKIENGSPLEHPATENNLIDAFGHIPENWESFIRVQRPVVGVYQILESNFPSYQKVNDVWTDVWQLRNMTLQEKTIKQDKVKVAWTTKGNQPSWTFDEVTCSFIPPPMPQDGNSYTWDTPSQSWIIKS